MRFTKFVVGLMEGMSEEFIYKGRPERKTKCYQQRVSAEHCS